MSKKREVVMTKHDLEDAISAWLSERHPDCSGTADLVFEVDAWTKSIICKATITPREEKP